MYDSHEELVILHTMARQVNDLSEGYDDFKAFKDEMKQILKVVLDSQIALKQEISLLRNQKFEEQDKRNKGVIKDTEIEKKHDRKKHDSIVMRPSNREEC